MTSETRVEQHTPGPWTYTESDCEHGGYGKCTEGCRVGGIWSPSRDAEVATFVTNPLWIRDRAPIAAVPDLLAALEAVHSFIAEHYEWWTGGEPEDADMTENILFEQMSAAIRRARGED